jgi:hypothetical protein
MSLIITAILAYASNDFGVSAAPVNTPAAPIRVERNSSPTIAVFSGTTIGSTSEKFPVLTNIVCCGFSSAGTAVVLPAASAEVTMPINVVTTVVASASSTNAALV